MTLSPSMRVAVGALSVVVYGLVGASFLGGSWQPVGLFLLALALFRAVVWFRQLFTLFQPDDDDD